MTVKNRMIIIIVALIFLLSGCYLFFEDTFLQTNEFSVSSSDIPKEFDGFRIVHVSDFHNTKNKILFNQLVEQIKAQNPDIIVITGDIIDRRRTDVSVSLNFVNNIKDVAPIYYVKGNHECFSDEYDALADGLKKAGVEILENRSMHIVKDGAKINIAGISDPDGVNEYGIENSWIVENEIDTADIDSELYTVLLSHRPELLETYAQKKIDLVFAGHAHGGQVRIPFVGGVLAPSQGWFPKITSGMHEKGSTKLIVSRGIGNSVFPFRVNNRPELIVAELVSK